MLNNNLKISKRKVQEAKIYYALRSPFLRRILSFMLYLTFFVSFVLFVLVYFEVWDKLGYPRLASWIFLSLFVFYNFTGPYLTELGKRQGTKDELNSLLSFDVLRYAKGLTQPNNKVLNFLKNILEAPRVQFSTEKIGLNHDSLLKIIESYKVDDLEKKLSEIINQATLIAAAQNESVVTSADILYGIIKQSPDYQQICLKLEMDDEDIQNVIFWSNRYFKTIEYLPNLISKLKASQAGLGQDWNAGYTLALNKFGNDLTRKGISGSYSIEGREAIISKIERALLNDGKRSCLLVGPTGVGKTTLGYGLAAKLFWGLSEPALNYHRVVELGAQNLASISNNKAEVQAALTAILNDAVRAGNIVLFIDEIQSLFSEGGSLGKLDATEIIRPYLESSRIRIVGTITEAEYETHIRPKTAIAGNFEVIKVEPTNENQTINILCDMAIYGYKKHHKKLSYAAIKEVYKLCNRIAGGKEMPAKAIDMLLEILSSKEIPANVSKSDILSYIQKSTNLPVADLGEQSKQKLLGLEDKIKSRLIGQTEAVSAVVNSLKRALTQERKNEKPIGSFLFLGPTGVGKTELAKSLAWSYFDSEEKMIRMDMSQYKEMGSINNFIGKKISGKAELEGGEFVKKVRQNPYSVVLLDEIEKANPEILDLFLQALDEGYLNDGAGEKVSLSNNIIIATSNAGALEIKGAIKSGASNYESQIIDTIQKNGTFRPEFLNRFDGIILFKPLLQEELLKVTSLTVDKVINSYVKKGFKITIEKELLIALAKEGYQPDLGARPLQRVVQNRLENYIADKILEGSFEKGGSYAIGYDNIYGAKG
jgi:ATP-dependent Clp protease ATP-binding subunit ClpC